MTERRYPEALSQDGRNLSRLVLDRKLGVPLYRQQEIAAVVASLAAKRSVLLVGDAGVGKTAILHGVAGELPRVARDLWELPTIAVLAGTRYLGDWQSKAQSILEDLRDKKGILYFSDIWNVLTVGTTVNDPSSLFDFLRPRMVSGELLLVGEVTPERFQAMQTLPLFASLFDVIRIAPLESDEIANIAQQYAATRQIPMGVREIRELIALCARFLPADRGPGQVLRLMQRVADYSQEKKAIGEPEEIDSTFVEKVFSIYSGLPRFVVSRTTTMPAAEIRQWFRERIIGQERAIESIVEVITLFKAGLHDPGRPIGTLLFVGPTGVGKTELAKALARFLFGGESRLLRFDLSEFKDYHAFQMLVGDPDRPQQPARLLDPVRAQPFQVILFDEIEKAHPNVWDMLLQLLDEGHVSPPNGARANFRNTIVIATSNVGSQDTFKSGIGFISAGPGQIPIKSLESVFRPELLNRFQHIVTFDGLTREHVRHIARREIQQLLAREGISSRNLAVEVGDDVLDAIVETGFDREYGARALKRQVQQRVLFPIAGRLMETEIPAGSILKLDVVPSSSAASGPGMTRVRVLDSEASREHQRDAERERTTLARKRSVVELRATVNGLAERSLKLATHCGKDQLTQRLNELDALRRAPQFWRDVDAANAALVEIDEIKSVLTRLETIDAQVKSAAVALDHAPSSRQIEALERSVAHVEEQIGIAERELTRMDTQDRADLLCAITPIGNAAVLRDLLFETYRGWATWRGHTLQLLIDPLQDTDPVFFSLKGDHAFGYLRREHGVHRLRHADEHEAVRVTVAAWSHEQVDVKFGNQRALKQPGRFGEKIRSQVEVLATPPFVLQNHRTIVENRELARELADSWRRSVSSDAVVRRYDREPFLLKDHLTGFTTGRPSTLKPAEFHELLCRRVDE